jgi:hypothetical protein
MRVAMKAYNSRPLFDHRSSALPKRHSDTFATSTHTPRKRKSAMQQVQANEAILKMWSGSSIFISKMKTECKRYRFAKQYRMLLTSPLLFGVYAL